MTISVGPTAMAVVATGLIAVIPGAVSAQTPQGYAPKTIVPFAQGGDRERAALARVPALAPLVQAQFGVGAADYARTHT